MIPIYALGAVQLIAPYAMASVAMQEKSASGISAAPLTRQLFAMGFAARVNVHQMDFVAPRRRTSAAMNAVLRLTDAAKDNAVNFVIPHSERVGPHPLP